MSMKQCARCLRRLKDARRTMCPSCAAATPPTGHRRFPQSPSTTGGREGTAYKTLTAAVRRRAMDGEPCYFCGGGFTWGGDHNARDAFTVHHLDALMDGGPALCTPDRAAPAHRACNSGDGL